MLNPEAASLLPPAAPLLLEKNNTLVQLVLQLGNLQPPHTQEVKGEGLYMKLQGLSQKSFVPPLKLTCIL